MFFHSYLLEILAIFRAPKLSPDGAVTCKYYFYLYFPLKNHWIHLECALLLKVCKKRSLRIILFLYNLKIIFKTQRFSRKSFMSMAIGIWLQFICIFYLKLSCNGVLSQKTECWPVVTKNEQTVMKIGLNVKADLLKLYRNCVFFQWRHALNYLWLSLRWLSAAI